MKKIYRSLQFFKEMRQERWVLFFVHLSVWLLLFIAFSMFTVRRDESMPVFMVIQYLYGFILFYLNYFFLTPRFLLPKKYLIFAISISIIVIVSLFIVDPLIHKLSINDFARNLPPEFKGSPPFNKFDGNGPGNNKFFMPMLSPGMFVLLFTFLTFSTSVRIFQKLKREEDINRQYHHEKLNAELMLLRQQVNPHFLFNSLNNIHSLANRKSDLTSEAIMKLSAILRYMLSENPSSEIPVTREIAMIENYIDLQKLWMKNTIQVDFSVENLEECYYIEPFILNPLVENAFKYGALPGTESVISIHLKMVGDWLNVNISNPVLLEKLSTAGSMGIGINNVIRRLELCYPGNFKMENFRKGNIYQINLSMKLKKNELHSN